MPASSPPTEEQARTLPWFGAAVDERGADLRAPYIDTLFLAVVVLLSCAPYVGGLGLYSDDWAFMAVFDQAGGDSFAQLVAAILPVEMATRPLQAIELSALYGLFGSDPLGYHVFNALVLATAVVLFHLSLRRLGFARVLALLIPLIFGLLPNYSTDRVWIAVFQANAAMALYFLSLFADLRFAASPGARAWLWKALAASALARRRWRLGRVRAPGRRPRAKRGRVMKLERSEAGS